ncbi:MGMT family protein [Zymobacter sp. IVIA_5232.4 C2]|uniref:MGMT family protein n=1 Tax=Zymobacter sp. IVIA_5232.4 C2 TaxID=3394855 RepID=UPI0039C31F78
MSDNGRVSPREQVLSVVARIPYGRVTGYGTIARMTEGTSARSVGTFMRQLPRGHGLPWHRVVRSDRTLADHGGNTHQRELLEGEGIRFDARGRIEPRFFWP